MCSAGWRTWGWTRSVRDGRTGCGRWRRSTPERKDLAVEAYRRRGQARRTTTVIPIEATTHMALTSMSVVDQTSADIHQAPITMSTPPHRCKNSNPKQPNKAGTRRFKLIQYQGG